MQSEEKIRAMALHALLYCERLFYLEEVERIDLQSDRVYAGQTLHEEKRLPEGEYGRIESFEYSSEKLGIAGKVDRLLKRDGEWVVYEHKKGRSYQKGKEQIAWDSDQVQLTAYALLVEEAYGRIVKEGRIRYHGNHALVKVEITDELRKRTIEAIQRAKEISGSVERPPITENQKLCIHCSLAPVCLPEENRIITEKDYKALRLFPEKRDKKSLHVFGYNSRLKKSAYSILLEKEENGEWKKTKIPINEIDSITLHGNCQISTQLIHYLATSNISLHWFSGGGNYIGTLNSTSRAIQRKIRQFHALSDRKFCLQLSKKLIQAKCETQLRYVMRATRKGSRPVEIEEKIAKIRALLPEIYKAEKPEVLLGIEGRIARYYFSAIPYLLADHAHPELIPNGRSKRPPKDYYNAILSFLYSLLYRSVHQAIISVGLEPSFGFFHTPRSSAQPLVLDLMELFRVTLCDISLIGSINRSSWNVGEDFIKSHPKVWLIESGQRKAIKIYEERLDDKWKHPIIRYSLSYYRMIELEVRLLEKEWLGEAGLFARARLR